MADASNIDEVAAQIIADPENTEAYLVLADLLINQGDLRGELIVLQHRLATGSIDKKLRVRAAKLLERQQASFAQKSGVSGTWRLGFVQSVAISITRSPAHNEIGAVFAHPSARFMTDLALFEDFEIDRGQYLRKSNLNAALAAVVADVRPSLRRLGIRQSVQRSHRVADYEVDGLLARIRQCAHEPISFATLPNLQRLQIASLSRLHAIEHPTLPMLAIDGAPLCDDAAWLLPQLRSIEWSGFDQPRSRYDSNRSDAPYVSLDRLSERELPALRDLTLRGNGFPTGYVSRPAVAALIGRLDRLCIPVSALAEWSALEPKYLKHLSQLLVTSVAARVPSAVKRQLPNAIWCSIDGNTNKVGLDVKLRSSSVQKP